MRQWRQSQCALCEHVQRAPIGWLLRSDIVLVAAFGRLPRVRLPLLRSKACATLLDLARRAARTCRRNSDAPDVAPRNKALAPAYRGRPDRPESAHAARARDRLPPDRVP